MGSVCGECGVPRILSRSHSWHDGCIVDRSSGKANLYLHEVSSTNALIDEVSKLIGFSVDNLVFDSAANSAEGVVRDGMRDHPVLFKAIAKPPLHRLIYARSSKLARGVGSGKLRLVSQAGKQGKRVMRVRIENPFNLYLNSSMIVGAIRAIYGLPVTYETTKEGDGYIMEARQKPAGTPDDTYSRLAPSDITPEKCSGAATLPSCGRCGAPRDMGMLFSWDEPNGLMIERSSGERMLFPGLYLMNSLVREFDRELGISTTDIFLSVERHLFRKKLANAPNSREPWGEARLRKHMALRGLGSLSGLTVDGRETCIKVENAFVPSLAAGRIIALWEHHHDRVADYDYSLNDNTMELYVYPA